MEPQTVLLSDVTTIHLMRLPKPLSQHFQYPISNADSTIFIYHNSAPHAIKDTILYGDSANSNLTICDRCRNFFASDCAKLGALK